MTIGTSTVAWLSRMARLCNAEFWFTIEINAIGTIVEFLAMNTPFLGTRWSTPFVLVSTFCDSRNGISPRRWPV